MYTRRRFITEMLVFPKLEQSALNEHALKLIRTYNTLTSIKCINSFIDYSSGCIENPAPYSVDIYVR